MIEREFEYTSVKDGINGIIRLQVFAPEPIMEDWECKYILELPNRTLEGKIIGIDSLQALLLTLKTLKTLLNNYTTNHEIKLTWLGMEDIGLNMIQ